LEDKQKNAYLCSILFKTRMNGDYTQRLSQEGKCREESESGILESASTFAHRVLKEVEALAGTTACKGVQIARLKDWAIQLGHLYFIDTIIFRSGTGGQETYQSLSPRASK
jgi:hypothetical protein